VIGEPTAEYYRNDEYKQQPTHIGSGGLIRSHSIIYAGAKIGDQFSTGHHAVIRENSKIGNHCSVGTYSELQGDCRIGDYCRLQSNVSIGQLSRLGDFVFIYPFTLGMICLYMAILQRIKVHYPRCRFLINGVSDIIHGLDTLIEVCLGILIKKIFCRADFGFGRYSK